MTPHGCRLRDLTYAGRIYVDVKYVMDRKIMTAKNVPIGLMPLMLRSSRCVLHGKNNAEMAKASNFHQFPASPPPPHPGRLHVLQLVYRVSRIYQYCVRFFRC